MTDLFQQENINVTKRKAQKSEPVDLFEQEGISGPQKGNQMLDAGPFSPGGLLDRLEGDFAGGVAQSVVSPLVGLANMAISGTNKLTGTHFSNINAPDMQKAMNPYQQGPSNALDKTAEFGGEVLGTAKALPAIGAAKVAEGMTALPGVIRSTLGAGGEGGLYGALFGSAHPDQKGQIHPLEDAKTGAEFGAGLGVVAHGLLGSLRGLSGKREPEQIKKLEQQQESQGFKRLPLSQLLNSPRLRHLHHHLYHVPGSGAKSLESHLEEHGNDIATDYANKIADGTPNDQALDNLHSKMDRDYENNKSEAENRYSNLENFLNDSGISIYPSVDDYKKSNLHKAAKEVYGDISKEDPGFVDISKEKRNAFRRLADPETESNMTANLAKDDRSVLEKYPELIGGRKARKRNFTPSSKQNKETTISDLFLTSPREKRSNFLEKQREANVAGKGKEAKWYGKMADGIEKDIEEASKKDPQAYSMYRDAQDYYRKNVAPYKDKQISKYLKEIKDPRTLAKNLLEQQHNKLMDVMPIDTQYALKHAYFEPKMKGNTEADRDIGMKDLTQKYQLLRRSQKDRLFEGPEKNFLDDLTAMQEARDTAKKIKGGAGLVHYIPHLLIGGPLYPLLSGEIGHSAAAGATAAGLIGGVKALTTVGRSMPIREILKRYSGKAGQEKFMSDKRAAIRNLPRSLIAGTTQN